MLVHYVLLQLTGGWLVGVNFGDHVWRERGVGMVMKMRRREWRWNGKEKCGNANIG